MNNIFNYHYCLPALNRLSSHLYFANFVDCSNIFQLTVRQRNTDEDEPSCLYVCHLAGVCSNIFI